MYKNKDKQREANKQAMQRYREAEKRREGITTDAPCVTQAGITEGITQLGNGPPSSSVSTATTECKRGLDIKCFEDLPPDVQATINRLSESNEEKAKRTAVAIKYQHLFPDRYYSTGAQ